MQNLVQWNPRDYDAQPLPHERWGRRLLERVDVDPDARVIDAGCGTGRDAEHLLKRGHHGRLDLLDSSREMIGQATRRLAGFGRQVVIHHADIGQPWPVPFEAADLIYSVATMHWLRSHRDVFTRAFDAAAPGSTFTGECGGRGNLEAVLAGAVEAGAALPPWHFADVDETACTLASAGWDVDEVWEESEALTFPDEEGLRWYLGTVVLHGQDEHVLDAAVARCHGLTIEYVRLNWLANRSWAA